MWRVLIADDEAYIRNALPKLIDWTSLDCELVGFAENGEALLEQVEKLRPDISIIDINMPRLNGLDAAKRLSDAYPDMLSIILTAYADFKYAQAAMDAGTIAYIVKTDVIEELPTALQKAARMLARSRSREQSPSTTSFLRALADGSYLMRKSDRNMMRLFTEYDGRLHSFRLVEIEFLPVNEPTEGKNLLVLLESSLRAFDQEAFPMDKTHICLLLKAENADIADIVAECEELLPVANGLCGTALRIAVSAAYSGAGQVNAAYAETHALLTRHMKDSDHRVLASVQAANAAAPAYRDTMTAETLREQLALQPPAYSQWLGDSMTPLKNGTIYDVRTFGMGLASKCRRICAYYDKELKPKSLHEYEVDVLSCETYTGMHATLLSLLMETAEMIAKESKKINTLIQATDAYIEANYKKRISLQDIACGVHANACYLSRFYKEKTGENLFDVVNRKKIMRAAELLRQGDMRTYEVAEAVGIADTSYFSKFFKKHMGVSPREYVRRNHTPEGDASI